MSETLPTPDEEPPPEQTPEPEPPPQEPEEQQPPAAASKAQKRIQHLSARANEAQRRAETAERELAEARALLAQRANGEQQPPPRQVTDADVDALAEQKLQQRLLAQRRTSLIEAGVGEFGAEKWNEATGYLATAGLQGRDGFMEAIADLDNAHQVLVALADDVDAVAELMAMRPVAMAARLGRMSAELGGEKKPALSKAPPPVRPVSGGRVTTPQVPDPAKDSKAWIEWRRRTAPKHLGGRGEAA